MIDMTFDIGHKLIADMAEEYADMMTGRTKDGEKSAVWSAICSAYMSGGERTLHKVRDIIRFCGSCENMKPDTAHLLDRTILKIFNRDYKSINNK